MAPRATVKKKTTKSAPTDPQGMFSGMVAFLIEIGVQSRRLQVFFCFSINLHFIRNSNTIFFPVEGIGIRKVMFFAFLIRFGSRN